MFNSKSRPTRDRFQVVRGRDGKEYYDEEPRLFERRGVANPTQLDEQDEDFRFREERANRVAHRGTSKKIWYDEDQEECGPEEWNKRQQGPIRYILAIAILVVITAVGWFIFRWFTNYHNGQVPYVQAEQGPYKVRPENSEGMIIPYQDKLVYGRLTPNNQIPVEHLLPPPEQPIMPPEGYATPQQPYPVFYDAYGRPVYPGYYPGTMSPPSSPLSEGYQAPVQYYYPVYQTPSPLQPQQQPQQQSQEQQGFIPHSQTQMPAPPSAAYSGYPPSQQAYPQAPAPVQPQQIDQSKQPTKQGKTLDDVIQKVQKPHSAGENAIATSTETGKAKYRIQLATFKIKEDAEKEKERLKKVKPDLFSKVNLEIVPTKQGDSRTTVYTVIVGSFLTRSAASEFCSKIPGGTKNCIILLPPRFE